MEIVGLAHSIRYPVRGGPRCTCCVSYIQWNVEDAQRKVTYREGAPWGQLALVPDGEQTTSQREAGYERILREYFSLFNVPVHQGKRFGFFQKTIGGGPLSLHNSLVSSSHSLICVVLHPRKFAFWFFWLFTRLLLLPCGWHIPKPSNQTTTKQHHDALA